nr:helix-turn-helix transcriptional regulator [uncultured Ruminococcus sp.]
MQKDIRTRITDTINERQLTRKDLAELIGSSQSTVTKILGRFIENPKKETLVAMCDKLSLTYSPNEIGRFEYSAAAFSKEELTAFNDILEAKLKEGKMPDDIIKAIREI